MASSENRLLELKIAGRYRLVPYWTTKLSFQVRPGPGFDKRAWKLWKPILFMLNEVSKKEKFKVSWVRIHSPFNLKDDISHAMGWWNHEDNSMFLCHFDKQTLLHEVGHAPSTGYHEDPWAKQTARLYQKYLSGKELKKAMDNFGHYLSGRRIYKRIYGTRPPEHEEPKRLWIGLNPKADWGA